MNSGPVYPARMIAPREDRSLVVQPKVSKLESVCAANQSILTSTDYSFQGKTLNELRLLAHSYILRAGTDWAESVEIRTPSSSHLQCSIEPEKTNPEIPKPVLIVGHQPEFFHPGVWVKNIVVSALAQRLGMIPLNLIVDNDLVKNKSLRVPSGSPEKPSYLDIPFDKWTQALPFEQTHVHDFPLFESFADRTREAIGNFSSNPLLSSIWPRVIDGVKKQFPLGVCFARPRIETEREWGYGCLELPISRIAEHDSFLWFFCHLIAQLPRFHTEYNTALHLYRKRHRIRNSGQPVSALQKEDQWYEAPFWVVSPKGTQRDRLFVRHTAQEVILRGQHQELGRLPLGPEQDARYAVEILQSLQNEGLSFRPRALTTTLFARTILGDLFFHGIGGAKYDELTDHLIEQFFGMSPPHFVTLTATLHLSDGPRFPEAANQVRLCEHQLRDLHWNPDRHLDQRDRSNPELTPIIARKQALSRTNPESSDQQRKQFTEIRKINAQIRKTVHTRREETRRRLQTLRLQETAHRFLIYREFPFCLYSMEKLRSFFDEICQFRIP